MDGIIIPNNTNLNQSNATLTTAAVRASQTQQGAQGATRVQVAPPTTNDATVNNNRRDQSSESNTVERRMQLMKRLANLYAVNDSRFTIYKEADGVYYTRVTNLRDGSVTVVPEPDLYAQLGAGSVGELIQTSV